MGARLKTVAFPLCVLMLTSCRPDQPLQDRASICEEPTIENETDVEGCVHRAAYELSTARDPATIVARAVVEACRATIVKRVQANVKGGYTQGRNFLEDIDTIASATERQQALYRVIQARAGNCHVTTKGTIADIAL